MSTYINKTKIRVMYEKVVDSTYFVDKSGLLNSLIPLVATRQERKQLRIDLSNNYICFTRPRRFGKSINAYMIATYFMKGIDSHDLFDDLMVSSNPLYENHINKHDVIFMDLSFGASSARTYDEYISIITENLMFDIKQLYPEAPIDPKRPVFINLDILSDYLGNGFIFVIDEWDYPLYMPFMQEREKERYIKFLSELLKGQTYVEMCYMTGIMPINTYDIGTPLNMFDEYIMGADDMHAEYFGFNDHEVDLLYRKYLAVQSKAIITRRQLAEWYDGYCLGGRKCLYNPEAVVTALTKNRLAEYWSSSGKYEELYTFIAHDIDGSRDAVAILLSGEGYPVKINQYASSSTKMTNLDQVFSAMVVFGFLTYNGNDGKVYIPNLELMKKFEEMLRNNRSLGYLHTLAISSEDVLWATKRLQAKPVEDAVKLVHDKEISLFKYNDEDAYAAIVNLTYIAARDFYEVTRENKGGTGYADFLFRPKRKDDDIIVIEMKVDDTPQNAIEQIKSREYFKALLPSFGETREYTGRIILVGIAYNRKDPAKNHHCAFEVIDYRYS